MYTNRDKKQPNLLFQKLFSSIDLNIQERIAVAQQYAFSKIIKTLST